MKTRVNFLHVVLARVFVQAPKDNGFIGIEKAALNFQNSGEGIRNWTKTVKPLDNLRKKNWIFRFTGGKQELKTKNSHSRYE